MITKPSVEKLLTNANNRFELVSAISKRGRQIVNGDELKVKTKEKNELTIAAIEFFEDKYTIVR